MRRLAAITLVSTLSSCALLAEFLASAFQKPRLTFKAARLSQVTLEGLTLDTVWQLDNPNAVGISLARADYKLSIEGKQVVAGSPPLGLNIPPSGSTELVFPASVKLVDIFPVATVLATQERAKYRVEGVVGVNTPIGIIDFPLAYEGEFEVPRPPQVRFDPPRVTRLDLSGATIEFPIVLTNRNSFPLPLQGMTGTVSIAGSEVGTLSTGDMGTLEGKGTRTVRLPLNVNLLQLAGAAQTAIRGGSAPVTFKAQLRSGGAQVPIDVSQVLNFVR